MLRKPKKLRTTKLALIALLIIGGYFVASPQSAAQAQTQYPVSRVSENPPLLVEFYSFDEKADYTLDVNSGIRIVGNDGSSFLHLKSSATGQQWLERFKDDEGIRRWLENSSKANFKGAIPLGFSK